jgi:putative transposase
MIKCRFHPTPAQELQLLEHCAHARYTWNLAVEVANWWNPYRHSKPQDLSKQLTEARAADEWLRSGSRVIQRQALHDFRHAMQKFFSGITGKPSWRKKDFDEGFCVESVQSHGIRRLNRKNGEFYIPKMGWVRFRYHRPISNDVKMLRVKRDRAGRWWVSFMCIPKPIIGPDNNSVVGIDRGITVTVTLSNGEMHQIPRQSNKIKHQERKLSRQKKGSIRRGKTRLQLARACAYEANKRRDWTEKLTTDIARRFDLIYLEDLQIRNMMRSARGTIEKPGKNVKAKAGLNRGIQFSNWECLVVV